MAQIKTIEMFTNYPNILLERFDLEDKIEEDEAKEQLLTQNIKG